MDVIYENKTRTIEYMKSDGLGPTVHLHKELEVVYVKSDRKRII